eukprot:TRINITY_DN36624_c0_g1_i1.p1 TRINITY_DN36624_c0_g1~~TRINITY_DN36624_c0_g1_i1.p1  ORF type:complete len:338 (-),score=67.17 TRINITY_DN36624_c0_g1_i1:91-1104(-)
MRFRSACLVVKQTSLGFKERKACGLRPCPVDCAYGTWEPWEECSKSCESGRRFRKRLVEVTAQFGGKSCNNIGPAEEAFVCNVHPCPVDCIWSDWGEFDECSVSCSPSGTSLGRRSRRRIVARPARYDGQLCSGAYEEEITCGAARCPVDCVFGMWQGWSECLSGPTQGSQLVFCGGGGSRTRMREILKQVMYSGQPCKGSTVEVDNTCASNPCPVDCKLDSWTEWSACSKDCGPGLKTRFRSPTIPAMYHGKPCEGQTQESAGCLVKACEEGAGDDASSGGGGGSASLHQKAESIAAAAVRADAASAAGDSALPSGERPSSEPRHRSRHRRSHSGR